MFRSSQKMAQIVTCTRTENTGKFDTHIEPAHHTVESATHSAESAPGRLPRLIHSFERRHTMSLRSSPSQARSLAREHVGASSTPRSFSEMSSTQPELVRLRRQPVFVVSAVLHRANHMNVRDVKQRIPRGANLAVHPESLRPWSRASSVPVIPSFLAVPLTSRSALQPDVMVAGLELVLRLVAHADWR